MATIVEYQDQAEPLNEYPARIVSPSRPSACCPGTMESLGEGQIEGLWRYVYKRCQRCGYTVRCFYAMSWVALAEKWAQDCPDLAHWRVRLKRKQGLLAQGMPAPTRPRGAAFRRMMTAPRTQGGPHRTHQHSP